MSLLNFTSSASSVLQSPRRNSGHLISALALVSLCALTAVPTHADVERSLLGIRIDSSARSVIRRYGTPSLVMVGGQSVGVSTMSEGSSGAGGSSTSPMGGAPGGAMGGAPGGVRPSAMPGLSSGTFGSAVNGAIGNLNAGIGQMGNEGSSPFGMPGGMGMGAPGGASSSTTETKRPEVTWIYDWRDGSSYEFTISPDGRVVQIRVTGFGARAVTSKGVGLGAKYSQVLSRYGFPESQTVDGTITTAIYSARNHAAFQFLDQRLISITVAAVE